MHESKTKISHSALAKYLECGRKYQYHYQSRLRGKTISGALIMGGAIDKALNDLLANKNLNSAIKVFDQEFEYNFINNEKIHIPKSQLIVYSKKDFDAELLIHEDEKVFGQNFLEKYAQFPGTKCLGIEKTYETILNEKEKGLTPHQQELYNYANWLCLRRKAHLMLAAYEKEVLPKIKNVIAVQKHILLPGKSGDEIDCYIDLIVEWQDGKKYVLDNKTSAIIYDQDEAAKSQQLIMYYYAANKEGMNLDGVGFVVMYKNIQKNRVKICEKCGHDGSGTNFKTCSYEMAGKRCNGDWKETIKPECKIDIILNQVTLPAQNLIIQSFKEANRGIKAVVFPPNVENCMKYGQPCVYFKKCWQGKDDDLVTLPPKKEK